MREERCEECSNVSPLNKLTLYENTKYCPGCLEKLKESKYIRDSDLTRVLDPTICVGCGLDSGEEELPGHFEKPLCDNCYSFIINRPFPRWIKIFAIGVIAAVVFGFMYNFKYLDSYFRMKEAMRLFEVGKIHDASLEMDSASGLIPYIEPMKQLANYYRGFYYLSQNKNKEALELFRSYKGVFSNDQTVNIFIDIAKAGAAFDEGDYHSFYNVQMRIYNENPEDSMSIAMAASGASCMYIVTGEEKYKTETMNFIQMAIEKLQPISKQTVEEYIQRIKYRLYSGEVIDNEEYVRRYPDGWKGDMK